ncbi:MAG: hypothetical protein Q4G19_02725 [Clostridia bacterium]|nr:hypothetical protein [Clostridia bacterium]
MTEFDGIMYRAVCAALELDPDGEQAARMMRVAWTGQPRTPCDANVCYRYAVIEPDGGTVYTQRSGTGRNATEYVFVPYTLHLIFYGPDAMINALRARTGILRDDGARSPRAILRQAGIVPLPEPPLPAVMYEGYGNEWRLRADQTLPFRLLKLTRECPEDPVTAPPRVTLYNENGEQGEISCERTQR